MRTGQRGDDRVYRVRDSGGDRRADGLRSEVDGVIRQKLFPRVDNNKGELSQGRWVQVFFKLGVGRNVQELYGVLHV